MSTITGITGKQYQIGSKEWEDEKYQYASSSHEVDHDMKPALIVKPQSKDDIVLTLKYAKARKIAVAIRTGGHQYSGASSTGGSNIQLDLSETFRGPDDRAIFENDGRSFVRTSVSWNLGEFNAWLGQHQVFVPHGQCTHVHLGGHVQTGGYGQLGRSFGLLGDHVISLEIIDDEGNSKEVTKTSDPDLFWALLGGSPGNLGVLTHFTLEVHHDSDYDGSRGLKAIFLYNRETLKRLLDILVEMSDNNNFPRNYDFCISVLSSSFELPSLWPGLDDKMREHHPEIFGEDGIPFWPRAIIVYAQWVPFSQTDKCDTTWFERIAKGNLFCEGVEQKPMSELTASWIFRNVREFDHPYVKRTYLTNSRTLAKDGWPEWVSGRIDALVKPHHNGCWLSAQLQCYGGKFSRFTANADNGTSFSWRDSSVTATMDCFHEDDADAKARAEDWQRVNDEEGLGPSGIFSKQDRRVLWGSYGDYDLDAVWDRYYEDKEKYQNLQAIRQRVDPAGVFTPNTFSVKRLDDTQFNSHGANGKTDEED